MSRTRTGSPVVAVVVAVTVVVAVVVAVSVVVSVAVTVAVVVVTVDTGDEINIARWSDTGERRRKMAGRIRILGRNATQTGARWKKRKRMRKGG